jgi:tol-pal system protein YbgF
VIRKASIAATLLAVAWLTPSPTSAANKDIERLALQIAAVQGQLAELQRSAEETRKELHRLTELIAQQNALAERNETDRRQQDEAVMASFRDLHDRVAELSETLEALKTSGFMPLPPPAADASAATGTGTGTDGAAAPNAPLAPAPAPRELYSQAYADYARGNYDLAIQGFTEYLKNYPDTDFTDNAQYWIGECLYGKKQYEEAIDAWNVLFRDYASSDKLPDARVKKGMALERLGRRSQALVEYRYVVDRYPSSQAARIARERLSP